MPATRKERWPGTTPGRFRTVNILLACECGHTNLPLTGYSGTPCACGRVYNLDGWLMRRPQPQETDHA